MKIRAELEDDFYTKGFNSETDPFKKGGLAQRLTKLYGSLEQCTVSILDGRWGSGKTVFVRQWKHQLETQGIPCIYFDAFAADYVESPFRALASAFVRAAKQAQGHDKKTYDDFLNAASKVAKVIAAPAAKIAVKAVTLGLIGSAELEDFKAVAEGIAGDLSDVSASAVKTMLEEQAGDEASFEALRTSLAELPVLLAKKLGDGHKKTEVADDEFSPSLVVIIDELDRCRPDFALGVLEVLKHFFRAERVHFVLVTNLNHLLLSVEKRYGVGEAAGEYIQKFYDFLIPFEESEQYRSTTNASLHASRLLASMMSGAETQGGSELTQNVSQIIGAYDLSLRQTERIVTNVVLAQINFNEKNYRPGILIALLATIKCLDPEMFCNIKNYKLDTIRMQSFILDSQVPKSEFSDHLLRIVRYHSDENLDVNDPEFQYFGHSIVSYGFNNRLEIFPYLANAVIDKFG